MEDTSEGLNNRCLPCAIAGGLHRFSLPLEERAGQLRHAWRE